MAYNIEDGLIDYRELEGTGPSPEELAKHTDDWTKFFNNPITFGRYLTLTPERKAELIAAALKANPLEYGYHGQSSEGPQEWGALAGSGPLPKNMTSLLNPQELAAYQAQARDLEAARGPDVIGDLMPYIIAAVATAGATGLLGGAAGTFAGGAAELGGALGADALAGGIAGDTLGGAALDYSMTGALGGGLGTAAGTSAGTGAALSALEPFSLATAAGAGGGLAAGAGTLSNVLSPFSLGSTSLPMPPATTPPATTPSSLIPGIPNNVLSGIGQGIFGLLGANAQSDALADTTNQWLSVSQPFRDQLLGALQPGSPALQQMADDAARATGVQHGNVGYNPSAWGEILNQTFNRGLIPGLSAGAGLGLNTAGNVSLAQAGSAGGIYDALAAGVRTATAPTLEDLIGQMSNLGLTVGGSVVSRG